MLKPVKKRKKNNSFFIEETQQRKFDKIFAEEIKTSVSDVFKTRVEKELELIYQKLNNDNEIFLPKKNQQIRVITNLTPADIFLYKIAAEEIIENCILVIYSMSKTSIVKMYDLYSTGKIKKITILVSHAWSKLKENGEFKVLLNLFGSANVMVARTHAKIFLAKTNSNNSYVCEGSGNFSKNTNIEQYIFENNQESYNFHLNWIKEL